MEDYHQNNDQDVNDVLMDSNDECSSSLSAVSLNTVFVVVVDKKIHFHF